MQKVLRAARKGTQVIYIPGNHDEHLRQFVGLQMGGIAVAEDAIHVTADGKRLWVVHGDLFDGVIKHARWLAHLGDRIYRLLLQLNCWVLDIFKPASANCLRTAPPIFLYVGRVAVEKNIDAFLSLDLPGSKWVAGAGPALAGIRERYSDVNVLGVLDQQELAEVYASADVFVFPSRTDTFGLVLLEAMACGLPVAAYPVTGPLDVLGDSRAGVMHEDLRTACLAALQLKREDAAAHARKFSWRAATEQFLSHLHPRPERNPGLGDTRISALGSCGPGRQA